MSRAGIVTIVDNQNYGNRLQNFALQETLRELGVDEVVTFDASFRGSQSVIANARLAMTSARIGGLEHIWARARGGAWKRSPRTEADCVRERSLASFTRTRVGRSAAPSVEGLTDAAVADVCNLFVAGSDQIWNPYYNKLNPVDFLQFADRSQRVAYAASFGISDLPSRVTDTYRKYLSSIPMLSVREERGAELVRALTGRDVPVVVDPVMLLGRHWWEAFSSVPDTTSRPEPHRPYGVSFFLGSPPRQELDVVAGWLAREGAVLCDLNSRTRPDLFGAAPAEFLTYLRDSKLVVTDSFHVAAFATLFRVPFLTARRGQMNSRLETLLRRAGLAWRHWATLSELEEAIVFDWDSIDRNIEVGRVESLEFLRAAVTSMECAGTG